LTDQREAGFQNLPVLGAGTLTLAHLRAAASFRKRTRAIFARLKASPHPNSHQIRFPQLFDRTYGARQLDNPLLSSVAAANRRDALCA